MISTNKHIDYINSVIKAKMSEEKIGNIKLFGNAESILDYLEDKPKKVPAIKVGVDFEKMIYDDNYKFMSYHRVRSSQVLANIKEKGYGNSDVSENLVRHTIASAIVFLNRIDSNANQEDLANSIMIIFPDSIPKAQLVPGVTSVKFNIIGFDYDTISIFRREYDGLEYDLGNNVIMIEVKYKIECSYTKSCINNCLN